MAFASASVLRASVRHTAVDVTEALNTTVSSISGLGRRTRIDALLLRLLFLSRRSGWRLGYRLPGQSRTAKPPLLATLQALLQASPVPLTRRELLARWPDPSPRQDTLGRTLARGVERGLFVVCGAGTKTDAFRYGLASQTNPPELQA